MAISDLKYASKLRKAVISEALQTQELLMLFIDMGLLLVYEKEKTHFKRQFKKLIEKMPKAQVADLIFKLLSSDIFAKRCRNEDGKLESLEYPMRNKLIEQNLKDRAQPLSKNETLEKFVKGHILLKGDESQNDELNIQLEDVMSRDE